MHTSEGVEAETSRAKDAWQREEQHSIVCSVFEIGDKLELTFSLIDLSSRVQLPTPWSTAEHHDTTFEIAMKEMSCTISEAPAALQVSTDGRRRAQHKLSEVVWPALPTCRSH